MRWAAPRSAEFLIHFVGDGLHLSKRCPHSRSQSVNPGGLRIQLQDADVGGLLVLAGAYGDSDLCSQFVLYVIGPV